MTSSISSWVIARRVAGADAHSLPPKRRVSGQVSSSNQSSLGGSAVAAKAAQKVQSRPARREKGGGCCCLPNTQRSRKYLRSNATSSWVVARRTATTSGRCGIGLERRRESVAAKGGGAPCVVDRQGARSSLHIKRRSYISSLLL